jgi:hypothetical protein
VDCDCQGILPLQVTIVWMHSKFILFLWLAHHQKKHTHKHPSQAMNTPNLEDYAPFPSCLAIQFRKSKILGKGIWDIMWCYWEQLGNHMGTWRTNEEHNWESLGTRWEQSPLKFISSNIFKWIMSLLN